MDVKVQDTLSSKTYTIRNKGVHHGAYITKDMDATVRFYAQILDMPIVVTLALPPNPFPDNDDNPVAGFGDPSGCRHYFFDCGNGDTIAFFSWNESFGPYNPDTGVLHHLAFALESEEELHAVKDKLEAHGLHVSKITDHFFCKSIYFKDPNGIRLEYSTYTRPCTKDTPFLEDPDPVPAAREILGDKMDTFEVSFREGHDFVDSSDRD